MKNADWCGVLVLHGSEQISTFLHWSSELLVHGSFEDNRHSFENDSTYLNASCYAMMGKPTHVVPVPSRDSTYLEWNGGPTYKEHAAKLLKLNGVREEGIKYADLINGKVFNNSGRWVSSVALLSRRPMLHLAANNVVLNMWLVRHRKTVALVWSTDHCHMEQAISLMSDVEQNETIAMPIHVRDSLCVLNPMYLVGRFRQAWFKTFAHDNLSVLSYMIRYIQKQTVPLN